MLYMHFVSVSVAVSVFQTVWMVEWALEWRQTVWQDLDLMTNWFESPCVSSRLFRLVNHLMSLDHDNSLNGSLLRLLTWKKGSLGVTQVSSLDQSLPIHSDSYILTHISAPNNIFVSHPPDIATLEFQNSSLENNRQDNPSSIARQWGVLNPRA